MITLNHNLMASDTANALSSHYGRLQTSTQRLSSGLRINSAADDAAGLAIRELMRADVAALNQGVRNANDAISMLQTFDGALGVIDEKLIRMKELAEQAATGTYDSTQRLMIDSEFQAMASEINRIARATDFNGIKLLDGNFGVGRTEVKPFAKATGVNVTVNPDITRTAPTAEYISDNLTVSKYDEFLPKEPVGPVNASLDVTLEVTDVKKTDIVNEVNQVNGPHFNYTINAMHRSSWQSVTDEVRITYDNGIWTTTVADGTNNGKGTTITSTSITDSNGNAYIDFMTSDYIVNLTAVSYNNQPLTEADMRNLNQDKFDKTVGLVLKKDDPNYKREFMLDAPVVTLKSSMGTATFSKDKPPTTRANEDGFITANLGNGDRVVVGINGELEQGHKITFSLDITGQADEKVVPIPDEDSMVKIHFGTMNDSAEDYYYIFKQDATIKGLGLEGVDVKTQDNAQGALVDINGAIVKKDKIRANYGALQNRFENTITNLRTQAENLQVAESRISDTDVALEMTQFVRNQILTQSAVAMLAQANSMPQLVMRLIG